MSGRRPHSVTLILLEIIESALRRKFLIREITAALFTYLFFLRFYSIYSHF